jgi:Metalloenzyme superfamily
MQLCSGFGARQRLYDCPLSIIYMNAKTAFIFLLLCSTATLCAQDNYDNQPLVVLVTLDGLRWQEVFSGADSTLLTQQEPNQTKRWWHASPSERRRRLMPFLWDKIAEKGQLHGNRATGSFVNVSNKRCVSYPGYNEMLCGYPDDQRIISNFKISNPNTSVLEIIEQLPEFKGQTAVFAAWDHFNAIYNTERSDLMVNAAFQPIQHDSFAELNSIATHIIRPWKDKVRPDWLTTEYAKRWVALHHPKVLHLALGETDEYGHEKQYGRYLDAVHRSDSLIAGLWAQLQSDPFYSNRTTLLITTDHGRGNQSNTWHKHNARVEGSDEVWMAALGPNLPALGEICREKYTLAQVAATMLQLLKLSPLQAPLVAQPIDCFFVPEQPLTPLFSEQPSVPSKK